MKKGISHIAVIFVFALLLGFGFTLMTPQEAWADICVPITCPEYFASCSECGGDGCTWFWSGTWDNAGTCCGTRGFVPACD